MHQRLGEGEPGARDLRDANGFDRLLRETARLIEAPRERGAEAQGEGGPMRGGELADGVEAEPAQARNRAVIEPECRHGQRRQGGERLARWSDRARGREAG